jgi:hypothetical protein
MLFDESSSRLILSIKNATAMLRTPKKIKLKRQSIKTPRKKATVGVRICPALPAALWIPIALPGLSGKAWAISLFAVGW